MSLINYVILCISVVNLDFSFGSTRMYFSKCGVGGFSCNVMKNKNMNVTYQCPSGVDDVTIMINQFNSPTNAESLLIQNCQKLTITVRCSSEKKIIRSLQIKNIGTLSIQRLPFQSHLPAVVVLENIRYIETIPSFTFSQVDTNLHTTGCVKPVEDFHTISLRNLTIDTVQSNGFFMPNGFGNFNFANVTINRLQSSAIVAKLGKSGEFLMQESTVEVVEHLAFRFVAKKVNFTKSSFVEISSGGINGTTESFSFSYNSVNALQPHAISVFSRKAQVSYNRFEYLKSGALEKISPGLMENSNINFGKLEFDYEFRGNAINFVDAGGLHPDMEAYENVASDIVFEENSVYCSCENSAWLFSDMGHGYNTAPLRDFYETFLDPASQNICSSNCKLPISFAKNMNKDGRCFENVTIEDLCETKDVLTHEDDKIERLGTKSMARSMGSTVQIISTLHVAALVFNGIFV